MDASDFLNIVKETLKMFLDRTRPLDYLGFVKMGVVSFVYFVAVIVTKHRFSEFDVLKRVLYSFLVFVVRKPSEPIADESVREFDTSAYGVFVSSHVYPFYSNVLFGLHPNIGS